MNQAKYFCTELLLSLNTIESVSNWSMAQKDLLSAADLRPKGVSYPFFPIEELHAHFEIRGPAKSTIREMRQSSSGIVPSFPRVKSPGSQLLSNTNQLVHSQLSNALQLQQLHPP